MESIGEAGHGEMEQMGDGSREQGGGALEDRKIWTRLAERPGEAT